MAEVLITLAVIGVVAAMALPSLIQKNEEKKTVAQLKKFYSSIQQAYIQIQEEDGPVSTWDLSKNAGIGNDILLMNKFGKYLQYSKVCGHSPGCFAPVLYTNKDNSHNVYWDTYPDRARAILNEGVSIMFNVTDSVSYDGQIYVDINGFKKPNQFGRDFSIFILSEIKLFPPVLRQKMIYLKEAA